MRTLTAAESAIVDATAGGRTALARVSVKDSGGTFRDLSSYPEVDLLKSVAWEEDIDSPGMTCTVVLRRAVGNLSLSPFHATSPLNKAFDASTPSAALIAVGREVKVEVAIASLGGDHSASYIEVFRGYVDRLSFPGPEVELGCVGLEGRLRDTWIEKERVYSYAQGTGAGKGVRIFEPTTAYTLGERVVPSQENLNACWYEVTTAGTTGSGDPAWPTGGGATVTSGTCTFTRRDAANGSTGVAVETVMQGILDDNLGAGVVTLYTPTSPSWAVKWFRQQRQSVLSAVQALAEQIGWCLRYRWDSGTSAWRLTFYDPNRSKTTPDVELSPEQVLGVDACAVAITDIRNAMRVVYSDSATVDGKGNPVRRVVERTSSSSITAYGRRFMEVAEGSSSNIDTSTEAQRLADAILDDLAEPNATYGVELQLYPWVELTDLARVQGDGLRSTTDLDLGVVAVAHEVKASRSRTRITCRGKPSGGWDKWLKRAGEARPADVHSLVLFNRAIPAKAAEVIVGGGEVVLSGGAGGRLPVPESVEVHLSKTAGFTPSESTLVGDGQAARFGFAALEPGETYYYRTRPYAWNAARKVLGGFSNEGSFVAGRAKAGHLDSQVVPGLGPPNGQFQHATRTLASKPPDHWELTAGTWGESGDAYYGSDSTNGRHVSLKGTGTNAIVRGGSWPVPRGCTRAKVVAAVRLTGTAASGRTVQFSVEFFADEALTSSVGSADAEVPYNFVASGSWGEFVADIDIPAGSNFAQLGFYKTAVSSAYGWDVGSVQLIPSVPISVEEWIAPTFGTGWSDYGSAWQTAAYCRDAAGFVHFRGLVQRTSGTGTTILTLPAGYRPAAQKIFGVYGDAGAGRIDVRTDGVVLYTSGGTGFLSLEGITFDTR